MELEHEHERKRKGEREQEPENLIHQFLGATHEGHTGVGWKA